MSDAIAHKRTSERLSGNFSERLEIEAPNKTVKTYASLIVTQYRSITQGRGTSKLNVPAQLGNVPSTEICFGNLLEGFSLVFFGFLFSIIFFTFYFWFFFFSYFLFVLKCLQNPKSVQNLNKIFVFIKCLNCF